MNTTLTPLGCAGWMPHHGWQTMSYLLNYRNEVFLLDAGTGVARLKTRPHLLEKLHRVNLLLSHFHLDHLAGFFFLNGILREDQELHVYGPGKSWYGRSTEEIVNTLIAVPFAPVSPGAFSFPVVFHDYHEGFQEVNGVKLEVGSQQHSNPSCSLRLDDLLLYATDTSCTEKTVVRAKGAKLLLHECWWDREDARKLLAAGGEKALKGHSHARGVGEIAVQAEVDLLFLIHYNPAYDRNRVESMRRDAAEIFPAVEIGEDLQTIAL